MNTAIVGFLLYVIFNFITTIQSDVSTEMERMVILKKNEIAACERDYVQTCVNPIALIAGICERLHSCMNQPEPKIGR